MSTKNPEYDYFTVALPKSLNKEFREFLDHKDLKRQKSIERAIQTWMKQMQVLDKGVHV